MSHATVPGWLVLPTCKRKCWFNEVPPHDQLVNWVAILDAYGTILTTKGGDLSKCPHLMVWGGAHVTTEQRGKMGMDKEIHFRVLVSENMETTTSRFKAQLTHIHFNGTIPHATFKDFVASGEFDTQGKMEKAVITATAGKDPIKL